MADLAVNRRAMFEYDILETFEAGIALLGTEVKSVRAGRMQLAGSFVVIRGGEAWITNATIPPYQPANAPSSYDPARARKLLLRRAELKSLIGKTAASSLTAVPLRVYPKNSRIKLAFATARRKKKYDRRHDIRKREDRRSIERAMKPPRG
jgi:SsrA-binding protein